MKNIQIYSTQQCTFCLSAKALLQTKDLAYEEIDVSSDLETLHEMIQRSGNRTVPQIFIDGESVGGYQELSEMNASGNL